MISDYKKTYQEMAALIGEQRTHKLFEMVKSTKYDFSMRLYSKQYCEYYILKHKDHKQPRILALELGYSLRFVQDVIKEKRCLPTNYDEEIVKMNKYNGIYQLFYELFGERVVNLVYDNLRGSTIYFPSKLHSKDYARKKIAENMDRLNVRELAKLTGYSERSVRRMISEITENDQ